MARDSAVGRERILVVPTSLALDNSTTNQHVTSAQNDLNQQILEVSQCSFLFSLLVPDNSRSLLIPLLILNTLYVI